MRIGFGFRSITPASTVELAGYAESRPADGVNDDIYARVLLLADQERTIVWVSLDVVALDHLLIAKVKEIIKASGLRVDELEFFATHTHSSIKGLIDTEDSSLKGMVDFFGKKDDALVERTAAMIVSALQDAFSNLDEFHINLFRGTMEGFSASRHDASRSSDKELIVAEIVRNEGTKILLYSFACHPTILHDDNLKISADFIGAIDRIVKENYAMTFFVNGACGDISTRFTRHDSSFAEVERLGELAAETINDLLKGTGKTFAVTSYRRDMLRCFMRKKTLDSIEAAGRKVRVYEQELAKLKGNDHPGEIRLVRSYLEGARTNLKMAMNNDGGEFEEIEIGVITINDQVIVTIPAELFSSIAEAIKTRTGALVFTLANGYHSYIVDLESYAHDDYEAQSSYYQAGEAEKMMNAIIRKIEEKRC